MEMKQIYDIVNAATREAIGDSVLLQEDMKNVVDVGTEIFNANSVDKFVRSLVDHIGKVIFVNRPYNADVPSVMRDGWAYGATLEKLASEMPEAVENESWELQDGASYDVNVFKKPTVYAKFFNKKTTYEIDSSIADMQARSGLSSAAQMSAFIEMIFNENDKSAAVKQSEIIRRAIGNMIAETFYTYNSAGTYTGAGDTRCVNLLSRYNTQYGKSLQAANAVYDADFIRYAVYVMGLYKKRLASMSKLFNIGGRARFTPAEMLHFVLLADFKSAADVFLQSDTFNEQFTALPAAETVPYWQGSGESYAFGDVSKVYLTTAENHAVEAGGVLGVMFDHDAVAVMNPERRITSNYNAKGEFTNYFMKFETQFMNDGNENFVVFYVA